MGGHEFRGTQERIGADEKAEPGDSNRLNIEKQRAIADLEEETGASNRLARESLYHFVQCAFKILEPDKAFVPGWHIELICEYLELVFEGKILRLIINLPPRHMKSLAVSVCWPVWCWLQTAESRWIFSSYSAELATFQSLKRRRLIESEWFRKAWANRFFIQEDEYRKTSFENNRLGFFKSTSTGGTVGGQGGDYLIPDDPSNPKKANSQADRESSNEYVEYLTSTRLDNPKTGRVVLVQQRVHHDDATSRLITKWDNLGLPYVHLSLPAEADKDEDVKFPISGKVIERKEGDYLWPELYGETEIETIKTVLGPYDASAQLGQNPTPPGGGMIKREWFKRYDILPEIKYKAWVLDTAIEAKKENDWTVAGLIGASESDFYIMNIVREHILAADLEQFLDDIWSMEAANFLVIEAKSSGSRLIQWVKKLRRYPVHAYKPEGDKVFRCSLATPYAAAGKIWLPRQAPWVVKFLEELTQFPRGAHDDQVDVLSSGIIFFTLDQKVGTMGKETDAGEKQRSHVPTLESKDWY